MAWGPQAGPVLVMGAGAIGCFIGGRLAASGANVVFVGRPATVEALRLRGLTLTDLDASGQRLEPLALNLHDSVPPLKPSLVLLCVKTRSTAQAAAQLAAALPEGTVVLSLQNGISNPGIAARAAPSLEVLPGMVPFNVAQIAPGQFHRGTTGTLAARDHAALRPWLPAFAAAGLPLQLHPDLKAVQWGKLLLNLNNPVNALSCLPLREQLLDRELRLVVAALQDEALGVLRAAGIEPARLTPLPPSRLPDVLRLPTPLFRLLASRMLRIDAQARSSMADDLAFGRPTEIDALCGEVIRLAAVVGYAAPLNARIAQLVESWPHNRQPRTGAQLLAAMGLA